MSFIPIPARCVKASDVATAVAHIQSLVQELPCATDVAIKKKKRFFFLLLILFFLFFIFILFIFF